VRLGAKSRTSFEQAVQRNPRKPNLDLAGESLPRPGEFGAGAAHAEHAVTLAQPGPALTAAGEIALLANNPRGAQSRAQAACASNRTILMRSAAARPHELDRRTKRWQPWIKHAPAAEPCPFYRARAPVGRATDQMRLAGCQCWRTITRKIHILAVQQAVGARGQNELPSRQPRRSAQPDRQAGLSNDEQANCISARRLLAVDSLDRPFTI